MKISNAFQLFITLSLISMLCGCHKKKAAKHDSSPSLSVMSYNLRYDNPSDSLHSWPHRKKRMVNQIMFYNPDFMGIQEGLYHQVKYLADHLTRRKYIGVGRIDGKKKGEFEAIFYNAHRYKLVSGSDSTMWLSPTPGQPGKGWDAGSPRVITWGKFHARGSQRMFYVFNCHLDNVGQTSRVESAKLIRKTIQKVAKNDPVFLTGDFNSTDQSKPYNILTHAGLKDAWKTSEVTPVGPDFTYSGFKEHNPSVHRERIDYIFINNAFDANKVAVISNFHHGYFLSDHLPVYAELSWNAPSK